MTECDLSFFDFIDQNSTPALISVLGTKYFCSSGVTLYILSSPSGPIFLKRRQRMREVRE